MRLVFHSFAPLFLFNAMSVVTCNVVNEEIVKLAEAALDTQKKKEEIILYTKTACVS